MATRQLTPTERFSLRQIIHIATLDALLSTRRWQPGEIVFHGGTSLHLVHNSPRYSEDLDFMVKSTVDISKIADRVGDRLSNSSWKPADAVLEIERVQDADRMYSFYVTVGSNLMSGVKVKVEMWKADGVDLGAIRSTVSPVNLLPGVGGGPQTFVPASDPPEIFADKVFAIGGREYLKARDVFDLHWLTKRGRTEVLRAEDFVTRFSLYDVGTASDWVEKVLGKRAELMTQETQASLLKDLTRWLPSTWPLRPADVTEMVDSTVAAIDEGVSVVRGMGPAVHGVRRSTGPAV